MNQKTTTRMPNDVELDGVIRGLDNASEYCGSTQAYDSQRNIREAAAAISLLRSSVAERDAAQSALTMLFEKWNTGVRCYQNGDEACDSVGNAFKLTAKEEATVLVAMGVPQNRGSNLNKADLCSDCPPENYPTDTTRCAQGHPMTKLTPAQLDEKTYSDQVFRDYIITNPRSAFDNVHNAAINELLRLRSHVPPVEEVRKCVNCGMTEAECAESRKSPRNALACCPECKHAPTSAVEPIAQGKVREAALGLVNALRHPSQGLLSNGGGLTMDARCALIALEAALKGGGSDSELIRQVSAVQDAALTARSSPVEGWQPIETAPKGVRVLVCGGTYATGDHEDLPSADVSIAHLMGTYGWLDDSEYDGHEIWRKPTHWQPLPPAPANDRGNQS